MCNNTSWILAICTIFVQGVTLYDNENYDGWIPISNEQALNIRKPDYSADLNYYISETNAQANTYFRDEAINIVTPQPTIIKQNNNLYPERRNIKQIENNIECNRNGVTLCPEEIENTKTEIQNRFPEQFITPNKTIRRAKKLVETNSNNDVGTASDTPSTTAKIYNIYTTPTERVRKVYEVTEDPESSDLKAEENESTENLGYIYDSPKTLYNTQSNYVDLLSKILLKYKIDANDRLKNYALSKQIKNINGLPPNPIDITRGFNSFNHLPVDPLLAVFLSNYGLYIPGVYGIEGNYKNLYGYLASNNIHNNRPFGFYKINSDTDSSSLL